MEPLDQIGGDYNAFTGQEMTGYWAKVDNKHLDIVLDWVSDIYLNSKIDKKDIEQEKNIIIEEINMYLDDPSRCVIDLWDKLLYGDQPAGWLISGEKGNVSKFKKQDFVNYLKSHYSSKNTVVAIAGNINRKEVSEKLKKYFKGINLIESKDKAKVVEKQSRPEVLLRHKKSDQTHICLGARGYSLFHKDIYAFYLLSTILGGGMSSRMQISVREKQGLAYYVFVHDHSDLDTGFLLTHAGINNKELEKAIKTIIGEYKKIRDIKISQKELKKAKELIKGKAILSMESSNAQAMFFAKQELLTNKILTLDEKFAKIEAVTINDIQRVAKDIFRPEKLNLALIGPFKDKQRFEKLLKI
jgi:predicted Zn-dependent peptidase